MRLKEIWGKIEWRFVLWLARRLPDCKPMTAMFSQSLDRRMTLRERIMMRLHLYTCAACRRYVEQIELMHNSFRHIQHAPVNNKSKAALSDEARERMKAALKNASRNL